MFSRRTETCSAHQSRSKPAEYLEESSSLFCGIIGKNRTKRKETKMKKLLIISAASLMLLAGSISISIAAHHYHGCGGMRDMTEMDQNEDGEITLEEFSARQMEKQKNAFDMLDMDNNGVIDSSEHQKFMEVHGFDMSSSS
jgi:hypothetical protein